MRIGALVCLTLLGCSKPDATDAGRPDGGRVDAYVELPDGGGVPDGGLRDGGPIDGGKADAGLPDSGSFDGGSIDGGSPDSGSLDSGLLDSGPLDGGAPSCVAVTDRDTTIHDFGASGTVTSIVWDGTRYAIVWSALTSSTPVLFSMFFAHADRDGDVIPGSVRRIFSTPETQSSGVLALGDGELGLAFIRGSTDGLTADNRAWFARLALDGTPIAGSAIRLSDDHAPHHGVAIAWSPVRREWAVAWSGTASHAYLSRVDAAGTILAPNAVQLDALTATVSPGLAPSLAWAADRWAIALAEYVAIGDTRVVVAEIDPVSAVVTRRIVIDDEGDRPHRVAMATDGTMYGVAWTEIVSAAPSENEMHFRRASVGGDALGTDLLLGEPALASGEASVLFDGSTFRLVFYEGYLDTGSVWSARIARDGTLLGAPGPLFAATPPYSAFPLLATDGCNDAVAWTAVFSSSPQRAEARLRIVGAAP